MFVVVALLPCAFRTKARTSLRSQSLCFALREPQEIHTQGVFGYTLDLVWYLQLVVIVLLEKAHLSFEVCSKRVPLQLS